jgi:hypothetical protein
MFRKSLSLVLTTLVINLACGVPALGATNSEKDSRFVENVKAGVIKLGTGTNARIEVRLNNKTKIKGYISEARDDSFTVVDKTGRSTLIPYPQVKQVKGNNLSTGAKIAIGVAIVAGILALVIVFGRMD